MEPGAQGAGRKAQGDLGHYAALSLGHYAALSFIVRGRGPVNLESRNREPARRTISNFSMFETIKSFKDQGILFWSFEFL
jgi:hypothetical protein